MPACDVCGGHLAAAFTTTDRNRRLSSELFRYKRCSRCRSLALTNVPPNLGAFYPSDYYRVPSTRQEVLAIGGATERAKLALVRRFVRTGRLLEIGPAIGAFLAVAQDAGFEVEAVEMDPDCCAFLEEKLGVPTKRSDDPSGALRNSGPYDAIALWQVIEHLPDPREVVAAAAAALSPGGILALAAPNPDSLQLRLLGSRWTHVDAPRHLHLIPIPALVALAAQNGLEVALATTNDASARGWNLFGWRESLASMTRRPRLARLLRVAGSLITVGVVPVERTGLRGATYTLVFRRPVI